jgi:hypothetical protein
LLVVTSSTVDLALPVLGHYYFDRSAEAHEFAISFCGPGKRTTFAAKVTSIPQVADRFRRPLLLSFIVAEFPPNPKNPVPETLKGSETIGAYMRKSRVLKLGNTG